MQVVILCGGLGTRLREETEFRPKPMLEIGGRPILWHIMKTYSHYGLRDFILCLGYRGSMIKDYFLNYEAMNNDFTICLGRQQQITFHQAHTEQHFKVTLADTGQETMTGGRLLRASRYIQGDTFLMTYGDGVADIDISRLLDFHHAHGKLATVTGVIPVNRFGVLDLGEDGRVRRFSEKPQMESYASAGYFVFNRKVLDYLDGGDQCILEREPLEQLARDQQIMSYRHPGFFYAMDTYREYLYLNELWAGGGGSVEGLGVKKFHWRDRPVFVTGATGLLGSWLTVRLVHEGARVVTLVRDWVPGSELIGSGAIGRVTVVRGDLTDLALLERALGEYEIDTIFHLGAQTIVGVANRNPLSTFESNIRGTWQLLEACRRSPSVKKIAMASSDKAYGAQPSLPYREDAPLQGRHPYDASKSCADLLAQTYAHSYGLPVNITRCGNLYGGGDLNWNRIVPGTIRSVLRGERPVIRSDGKFIRDYFFVEDAVDAYLTLAASDAPPGEAFNFSNEQPVSVIDLARKILSLMGADLEPVILNQASNEIRDQFLSSEKARAFFGWRPAHTLEQGLGETIRWYRRSLEPESINALASALQI